MINATQVINREPIIVNKPSPVVFKGRKYYKDIPPKPSATSNQNILWRWMALLYWC